MPCQGLVTWGAKVWTLVSLRLCLAVLLALSSAGCGQGETRKRAVECQTTDDCDDSELGVCDSVTCEDHECVVSTKPDGQKCNDENPMTHGDACLTGLCKGVVKVCGDDLGPCLKAVHDPKTDECVVEPVDDDTPCDDDDACTQNDVCEAGECVGKEPKDCSAADACHVDGKCDPESGECSEELADDGAPCDDGQACTSDDVCKSGTCGGEPVVCDDGLDCSVDSCDMKSGACSADMTGCKCATDADCDDGNACNGVETCDVGSERCRPGEAVVCVKNVDPCLNDVCVPETGACVTEPAADGTACVDASQCTTRDVCKDGECVGTEPVVCAALNQCHARGTCDPATGACSNPEKADASACDDGNACTVTDTCQAGACVGSAPVACTPSDQCHDAGVCNTSTGSCSKPPKQDGVKCDDGLPCTLGDACQSGACTPASQVQCVAADSCHLAGSCDNATGRCSSPAKADGASCSDGLICTSGDVCSKGVCGGASRGCDDGIACTKDSCSEQLGGCTTDASACSCQTSADCDDKNPCNGVETCDLATLKCVVGVAVDCKALDSACSVGACEIASGKCVANPKANGTACDDGDKCTGSSTCQAGACVGQNPLTCVASDQCHVAGTCNPATGVCSNPNRANGTACNDGNACTQTDSCQSGTCVGASPTVCPPSDDCHNAASCNTSTGVCEATPKPNGTACNDGNACTQTDSCQGGVCSGQNPLTCAASDQCHDPGSCDTATGKCSNPVKKDGTACNDANGCTQTDVCQSGVCTGTKPKTCAATDQCHNAGACDPKTGACSNPAKADGTACNDNNACTQSDTCSSGVCTGASPVVCSPSDQCHDVGSCDVLTGKCTDPNKKDGTPCNDGKACTSSDSCTSGVCGGAVVSCDDKIACTVDRCVEPSGCDHDRKACQCAKDSDCDDGDACTGVETCNLQTLTCVSGTKVNCSNLDDACNIGTCDTAKGTCSAKPRPDNTVCSDGNACTKSDACLAGKCVGSNPVSCSASDQCHDVGTCDKATGICSNPAKPNGSICTDNDLCTQNENCQAGVCTWTPVVCAAPDQCHLNASCDPAKGCVYPVKTGSCDDGNKCTQTDSCVAGVCTGGNPVVCRASDQCHDIGACDAKTGACSDPPKTDGVSCNDSNQCTRTDTCQAGKCTGGNAVVCSALDQCHVAGTCDPQTALCSNPPAASGTSCKDADACTTGETCDGKGNCSGGSAVICSAPPVCQISSCDALQGCTLTNQPDNTACDDLSQCTVTDVCLKGACVGTKRSNKRGDWADDPGSQITPGKPSSGPISVDTFTDGSGNVHLVGTYSGPISFNDKDDPNGNYTTLQLPANQGIGIYWAVYDERGKLSKVGNLGGVIKGGTLSIAHAAANKDGSFALLGTFSGAGMFGLNGKTKDLLDKSFEMFVARYATSGNIDWVVQGVPGQGSVTPQAVANFDDRAVIAIGHAGGGLSFLDANNKQFGSVSAKPGVWAMRVDVNGGSQWANTVVYQSSSASARAVTAHEDGSASLTGGFTGSAGLGPTGKLTVSVLPNEQTRDIWFQKLDEKGNLKWGGRVGGDSADVPGDVARITGGGLLLLANTLGAQPNADDAKTTQQLHVNGTGLQTHVLSLDVDGVLQTDGMIANTTGTDTQGYQLKLDAAGAYAVGGTFATNTNFWSNVGFGSDATSAKPNFSIKSAVARAPATLFLARVDPQSVFKWGVQAGGDNSGMAVSPWSVVLAAHPSHSATLAGNFNATAVFGDQVTESLSGAPDSVGSGFVVHLNSEAEYDYCP